jgi:hypothetical protein
MLLCEVLHSLLPQVDGPENLGIFRFQGVYDAMQASTNFVVKVGACLGFGGQLTRQGLQGFALCFLPSVAVDHGIAKQPVKPSDRGLTLLELVLVLIRTQVGRLNDVLGKPEIRNAALHEREKLLSLGQELIENDVRHRGPWWED